LRNIKDKAEMELLTKSKSGETVRLAVELDRHATHQVYAYLVPADGTVEQRSLCHCWGVRKTREGLVEGIVAEGKVIEVPKDDWKAILAVREDLRDKENLEDIHLVRVFSQGDQLTIDGYTLSARVDRETWKMIESRMQFVDSSDNDTLYAGDRFVGWVVKEGKEAEVERILGVKPESSILTDHQVGTKGAAP
jgi:hypothetical protein